MKPKEHHDSHYTQVSKYQITKNHDFNHNLNHHIPNKCLYIDIQYTSHKTLQAAKKRKEHHDSHYMQANKHPITKIHDFNRKFNTSTQKNTQTTTFPWLIGKTWKWSIKTAPLQKPMNQPPTNNREKDEIDETASKNEQIHIKIDVRNHKCASSPRQRGVGGGEREDETLIPEPRSRRSGSTWAVL